MSSSALNSPFMLSTAASIARREAVRSAGSVSERSCATNRFSACSGWRRSWLAAARKRDLAQVGELQLVGALLDLALQRRVGALQLGRHVVELLAQRLQLVAGLDRDAVIERPRADARGARRQRLDRNRHSAREKHGRQNASSRPARRTTTERVIAA